MDNTSDVVEVAFLGVMNANDRDLSLSLTAWAERNLLKRRIAAALDGIRSAGYVIESADTIERLRAELAQVTADYNELAATKRMP